MLADAVTRDRERVAQGIEADTFVPAPVPAIHEVPELDPLATLPTRVQFDAALAELRSEETGLIVIGIDDMNSIRAEFGDEGVDQVRRSVAGRLVDSCRRNDVVAWIDEDAFAVLLVDVDRRAAFEISKRLRSEVSEPIALPARAVELSISVGLSHEDGLVDPVELFVSAESAMVDAREAGGARMLVAC
jgi:diguanylate cyclase (GGDEF)-like protein